MKFTWFRIPPRTLAMTFLAALTATSAAGGSGAGAPASNAVVQGDRRALPKDFITRASVNYSPYRTSRNESELEREVITADNVLQDLRLIQAAGIGTIRLFSSRYFAETVLQVIRANQLDIKVQLGAYPNPVPDAAAEADNQVELDACIRLANAYGDIVLAVSVGNETMVDWSAHKVDPLVMAGYLRKVRTAVTQPVTTNDNWAVWADLNQEVAATVDYAAVHVYPFLDTFYNPTKYDWRQASAPEALRAKAMVDATLAEAKKQFEDARAGLVKRNLGHLPMVIGETGWAAVDTAGGPNLAFRAHPVNQRMYFDGLQAWVQEGRKDRQGPKAIFYFQAFDEPWKQGDDGWGLFNAKREARYAVQPAGTCGVTWVCEAGKHRIADAVKWVPPTLNPAITARRYTLFANAVTAGEQRATGLRWDPFALTAHHETDDLPSPDGGAQLAITPNPTEVGWGLFLHAGTGALDNLSHFSGGRLNFQLRTDGYPGKIEIGIRTDTEDRDVQEAFLPIAPGNYGYCNANRWCEVSIPISTFAAQNPKLDLRYVSHRFIIADRFSVTGKPSSPTGLPVIRVDNLHWTR